MKSIPLLLLGHQTDFPEPRMLHLEAIRETVPVYEGKVRILKDVTLSPRLRGESVKIPLTFSYQACDDRVCYAPFKASLAVELSLVPHDGTRAPEELRKKGSGGG